MAMAKSRAGKSEAEGRDGVTVTIPPEPHKRLKEYAGDRHKLQWLLGQVVSWFLQQPDTVKRVVLGDTGGMEGEHAAALELMAQRLRQGKK